MHSSLSGMSTVFAKPRQPLKLFYAPDMEEMAKDIADRILPGRVELGKIRWSSFSDTWPNLFVEDASLLCRFHCAFLANLHNPGTLFEQLAIMNHLPRLRCKTFKVIVPFFPVGTMERVQTIGEVATANTLSKLLSSNIPQAARGLSQLYIFDLHALANAFFFSEQIHVVLATCTTLLKKRLNELKEKNIIIAFPDDGAQKRFGNDFPQYEHAVCTKMRDGNKRKITLKDGDVTGKYCVIVDDLIQSGGTLIECAKVLKAAGACNVSAFATHAVFPNENWKRFVEARDLFATVWVTNSIPTTTVQLQGRRPFEVLNIATTVSSALVDGDENV